MNIETEVTVKQLNAETLEDFLSFMDKRLPNQNTVCYGEHRYLTGERLEELKADVRKSGDLQMILRREAAALVLSGKERGYLAYVDSQPVGWCNAAEKSAFVYLGRDIPDEIAKNKDESILAVTDMIVDPRFVNCGIAEKILKTLLSDAAEKGFAVVETYPSTAEFLTDSYAQYIHVFEKNGFKKVFEGEQSAVLRRNMTSV